MMAFVNVGQKEKGMTQNNQRRKRGRGMNKYTKEMSESEILMALANIRTELLNAVDTIETIAKNIAYKGGDNE